MSGLFNEFLYYYLRSAKQLAQRRASGTTFKELSGAAFSKLPIPLAPEGEQHRIVEKIEELLSELDKGIESLKTAREQLKVYRQAVLKHAFEGKLTEKWRRDHASELPSAEAVLEKTKGERERRHEEQLGEWKKALKAWESGGHKGRTPAKPAKPRELQHLTKTELADLPALPEGWGYVRAESISDFITKGTTPKENDLFAEKGDVPFIRDYILDAGNTSISR